MLTNPQDASNKIAESFGEISCLVREKLLPIAQGPIGPNWPDVSTPAPRVAKRSRDAAVIVALEGDAVGPIRIGANDIARAWSDYLTQTLGVPEQHVHQVPFAGIAPKSVQGALDDASKQTGASGHLWMLFIGRGRIGCPSRSTAGQCVSKLWLELASAYQDTPEPREWAFDEVQRYVARRNRAPVVVIDIVAGMPKQANVGVSQLQPALPAPSAGVTFTLVHPVQPIAIDTYWYPMLMKVLRVGAESNVDITWPLAVAGSGVLPGTSGPAFSKLLLAALRGWGDGNSDGIVTPDEAVQKVRDALAKAAPTLHGVPLVMGPGRGNALVPSAEKDFPATKAPASRLVGGQWVLFNAASRAIPSTAGPSANDIDWHMFDDIGDTSGLSTIPRVFDLRPEDFADRRGEYESLARHIGENVRASYEKYSDSHFNRRIEAWCGAARSGWLAPFRHEAWHHCASFVSYASAQLLVWSEFQKDWRLLDVLLREDSMQGNDGLALLRDLLDRFSMLEKREIFDASEVTCERLVRRRDGSPTRRSVLDPTEWVYIPGGAYLDSLVQPAFEIQRTEATNAQYDRCVRSGTCTKIVYEPAWLAGADVDPKNGEQPVVGVTWDQARSFCRWNGGSLPTATEWDHAAIASTDLSDDPFAWTRRPDACAAAVIGALTQYNKCTPAPKGPASVCSRPRSNSPLGLCDMVGNVSEWVSDAQPVPSIGGNIRLVKGHNWTGGRIDVATNRVPLISIQAGTRGNYLGFRCARPAR